VPGDDTWQEALKILRPCNKWWGLWCFIPEGQMITATVRE